VSNKSKKNIGGKFRPRGKSGDSDSFTQNATVNRKIEKKEAKENTLRDFSNLNFEQQKTIKKDLEELSIKGEILGYVSSPLGFNNPVIHVSGFRFPIILKELNFKHSFNQSQEKNLSTLLKNYASLEINDILKVGHRTFLKRTYSLNTLQDALNSSITILLPEVLLALEKTLSRIRNAAKENLIHGNIHPGNICFKMEMSGDLLDAGLNNFYFNKTQKIDYTDVYGFGLTLKEILSCPSIICDENGPSRDEIISVFGPIIESSISPNVKERISIEALSSIYLDFLPMLSGFSGKEEQNAKLAEPVIKIEEEYKKQEIEDKFEDPFSFEDNKEILEDTKVEIEELFGNTEIENNPKDFSIESNKQEVEFPYFDEDSADKFNIKSVVKNPSNLSSIFKLSLLVGLLFSIFFMGSKVIRNFNSNTKIVELESETSEYEGKIYESEELTSAWSSGIASQMKLVADQAVYKNSGRLIAERVILASVTSGDLKSDLVDSSLLRVAFSNQWEEQLQEDDRRYALSLGLIQILKNKLPSDLGKIEDRHTAVLLALMSSGASGITKFLGAVPVSNLEQLPVPFGPAFQLLSAGKQGKTCGDEDIITLARLGTRGIENPVVVNQFLLEDFKRRMSSLAILFSSQADNSRKVLDIILLHPNLSLNNPETFWAKKVNLIDWNDVEPSDKLFLIAGVPLRGNSSLGAQSIAKLFLNPSARVRGFAAGLALDKIQFRHKGAAEILAMIHNAPDVLTQDQFVMLGQILEDPKRTAEAHRKIVHAFIASNPPIEIAKHLLLSSSNEKESTILDSALGIYLGEKGWVPTKSDLEIIIKHPDKVVRMFAYQNVFNNLGTKEAIVVLRKSMMVEVEKEYKKQLQEMIQKLENLKS
jgi:hypothetical protein